MLLYAVSGYATMIGTKVALFEMPPKPEQRSKWETFLSLCGKKLCENVIYKVCEQYFEYSDIKSNNHRKLLIAGAVPSIVKQEVSSRIEPFTTQHYIFTH